MISQLPSMSSKSLELPPVKNVSPTRSATKVAFVATDPATGPLCDTPSLGLVVFQSSGVGLSSTALPSISKTWSTAGGGDGGGGRVGLGDGAKGNMLVAVDLGGDVIAIVPINKMANTATPNMNFAKFGFLVIGSISFVNGYEAFEEQGGGHAPQSENLTHLFEDF